MAAAVRLEDGVEALPGHRLVRFLGRGGFGEVWEAHAPGGRRVALKFLPGGKGPGTSREVQSIEMVRRLRHPHLVEVYNVWSCPGFVVVAMELAEGSLEDLLAAHLEEFSTPIHAVDLLPLLTQAAEGLDFLNGRRHRLQGRLAGLQHGDVKPANLLLIGDTIKVSDFGLASPTSGATRPHRRAGTVPYTAPEVVSGWLSDRADQHALAVTYYRLRTGRLPFPDVPEAFAADYVRPAADLSLLPQAERPAVARALAVTPQDRWPSCADLMDHLRQAQDAKRPADAAVRATVRLGDPACRGGSPERRRWQRRRCDRAISFQILGDRTEQVFSGQVSDVTGKGIGLRAEPCLPRGTILVLTLPESHDRPPRAVLARVARAERRSGAVRLGCAFASPLAEVEVDALARTGEAPAEPRPAAAMAAT